MLEKYRISMIVSKRMQMLFVACVSITGDDIGVQYNQKKRNTEKKFTFSFFGCETYYITEIFKRLALRVAYKSFCSINRVLALKSSPYEKNKFEHNCGY
jgi:hypothetical protein